MLKQLSTFVGALLLLVACASRQQNATELPPAPDTLPPIGISDDRLSTVSTLRFYDLGPQPEDFYGMDIIAAADGDVYYTTNSGCAPDCTYSGNVGRLNPATKAIDEVAIHDGEPSFLTRAADGAIWSSVDSRPQNKPSRLARIAPFSQGGLAEIPMPATAPTNPPDQLTAAADGHVWFTTFTPVVGKIPESGPYTTSSMTTYTLPSPPPGTPNYSPESAGISSGAGVDVWFTDFVNGVVYTSTSTGQMMGYVTPQQRQNGPTVITEAGSLALGSNGKEYFGGGTPGGSAYFDSVTANGVFTDIPIPDIPISTQFTAGAGAARGLVAIADYDDGAVVLYTIATKKIVDIPLGSQAANNPDAFAPAGVAVDEHGDLWAITSIAPVKGRVRIARIHLGSQWSVFPSNAFRVNQGQKQLIAIGETGDSGPFTFKYSNNDVSISSVAALNDDHNFWVNAQSAGSDVVTVVDKYGHSENLTITAAP